ncbi:FAD-binding protein [Amycolatopsis sp., V23-08]|uniref:L-aspartate oxidase n=1 Tax=Amycolatopsis heterodermiae TaxID=3110235 RepID=A0ABU5R8B0_9PSEU|nr:FAD-binding protein [Amycolatopsis sp., V23-08]MEA5362461.1 FAD-binding protein [Amycolatopsis sp., V23-08]
MTADLELAADVLVVGGGLAATWTALAAAQAGGTVVLADKGYCGTSGVTATAGVTHWFVPPERHEEAIAERHAHAGGLADPEQALRVLRTTWERLPTLDRYYPFPVRDGQPDRTNNVRGPEYLRAMRGLIHRAGVRILDHHPALELLLRPDGSAGGAAGVRRQAGGSWRVRAGAVVLATGGTAFRSNLLGSRGNTGDGHLMAVEAGARLSGMEFSNYYTLAPAYSTMARSMSYLFGTYTDADGVEIELPPGPDRNRVLGAAMLRGPVFTTLDRTPSWVRERIHLVQPNFLLPFARRGIDPFTERFEVTLLGEGTIRGVGGLVVTGPDCTTDVPGLFAAGDVASRVPVVGAISGGGSPNSAWAVSSGTWAGRAAVRHARAAGPAPLRAAGRAGIRPSGRASTVDTAGVVDVVREELNAYGKNMFRDEPGLQASLSTLDSLWTVVDGGLTGTGRDAVTARETASLVAMGRWVKAAALRRHETRGMHWRTDDPAWKEAVA